MKLVSWNVNGIRACINKGFYDVLKDSQADIFCIQETKMQEGQIEIEKHGYYTYMNSANFRIPEFLYGQLLYTK